ncbi:MAG: hypothetical protein K6C40_16320 [Thermoguttaceae bacterium]|nr:hypothetical protein [Thermoguttaceae bacterium]
MKKFNPIRKISLLYFVTFFVVLSLSFSVFTGNVDAKQPQTRAAAQKAGPPPLSSLFGGLHNFKETSAEKKTSQPKSGGVHRSKEVVKAKEEKTSQPPKKPFDKLFSSFGKKGEQGKPKVSSDEKGTASTPSGKGAKGQNISKDKLPKDIPEDAEILSDAKVSNDGTVQEDEDTEKDSRTATASNKGNHEADDEENPNLILEPEDSILNEINKEVTTSAKSQNKDEEDEKSQENELGSWNETAPDLEFIETHGTEPMLNVSSQRLTSPAEVSKIEPRNRNGNSTGLLSSAPGSSKAQIGARIGRQVTISRKEEQAELLVSTNIPENLLTGVKNRLEIEVENTSKYVSEKSTVEVQLPIWIQVLKMEAEKGVVRIVPADSPEEQKCTWFVGDLKPGAHEIMILQVVPQRKTAANIEVSWSNQQVSSNQTIISEEPEIRMEILGPNYVQEGKETKVCIQVSNTGSCSVKNLNLVCTAEGCQSQKYFVPGIPVLYPGEKRDVELNIRPSSREKMKLHVDAMVQNRSFGQSDLEMTVNFTDLQIRFQDPGTCFVGMNQKIPVEVSNQGNIPVDGCSLCVELPPQLEFTSEALSKVQKDSITGLMTFNILPLKAGETQTFTLDVNIKDDGDPEIPLGIISNSRTISETKIPLHIEGVANVQMELNLPSGALTALEPGTYEVRLINTGSQKIEDGKLFVFFSEGFEPQTTFNGGKILDGGIVMFNVLPLVPGESQTFQIQAQVRERGNYPIRCQLKSEKYHLDLLQQGTAIFR